MLACTQNRQRDSEVMRSGFQTKLILDNEQASVAQGRALFTKPLFKFKKSNGLRSSQ